VPIGLNTLLCEILLKTQFDRLVKYLLINRNAVIAYDDPLRIGGLRRKSPPLVLADVINTIPFERIDCEYFGKDVFGIFGKGFGDLVLSR